MQLSVLGPSSRLQASKHSLQIPLWLAYCYNFCSFKCHIFKQATIWGRQEAEQPPGLPTAKQQRLCLSWAAEMLRWSGTSLANPARQSCRQCHPPSVCAQPSRAHTHRACTHRASPGTVNKGTMAKQTLQVQQVWPWGTSQPPAPRQSIRPLPGHSLTVLSQA